MSWIRHKKPSRVRPVRGRLGRWRECLSIQAHLAYCELKLRLRTRPDQIARLQLLDHLHWYWRAGCFPENKLHASGRQPIFIDDEGTYCAVGYLMAQSGANDLAAAINRDNRFVYIEELDLDQHPEIRSWLSEHELSQTEAALIQPGYGGLVPDPYRVEYGIGVNDFFYPVVIGVLLFWLILNLGPLMLTTNLLRRIREFRHGINPFATTRQHEESTIPFREKETKSKDTKPFEADHRIWSNDFSLFRKRLGYSALITSLNLVLVTGLVVTGMLLLPRISNNGDYIGTLGEMGMNYTVSLLILIGMPVFLVILNLGLLMLNINIWKTCKLRHAVSLAMASVATTRQHEEGIKPFREKETKSKDTKPFEADHRIWSNDFSLFRKRLGYSALITSLNLVLVTSLAWILFWWFLLSWHPWPYFWPYF